MNLDLNFSPYLAHLQPELLEGLIDAYYAKKSLSNLEDKFILTNYNQELSALFPFFIEKKETCPHCQSFLVRRFLNREQYNNQLSSPFCQQCKINTAIANRSNRAPEIQLINKNSREALVNQCFDTSGNFIKGQPIDSSSLSFVDYLYLEVLIKYAKELKSNVILGVDTSIKLAPLNEIKPLKRLLESGIISLIDTTPENSFTLKKGEIKSINPFLAHWKINLIQDNINLPGDYCNDAFNIADRGEILDTWLSISVDECLEYLLTTSYTNGYPIVDVLNDDFNFFLKSRLHYCSVSYMYWVIWKACRISAEHFKKSGKKHSKKQINEFTLWEIESQYPYYEIPRPSSLPRSKVSEMLFKTILGFTGDKGYYHAPLIN